MVWNNHQIRPTRNARTPHGRPNIIYTLPERYSTRDYLIASSPDEIDACLEACRFPTEFHGVDNDLVELVKIEMDENGWQNPTSPFEAMELYIDLHRIIENM